MAVTTAGETARRVTARAAIEGPAAPAEGGHPLLAAAMFGGLTAGAAAIGAGAARGRARGAWYRALSKPRYQPPRSVYASAWAVLYPLIAGAGWRISRAPAGPERNRALGWWGAQLALNAAWPWLFFRRREPKASLVEAGLLAGAIGLCLRAARRVDRPAAWMLAPYLGWVGFASVLNAGIVRRNPRLA